MVTDFLPHLETALLEVRTRVSNLTKNVSILTQDRDSEFSENMTGQAQTQKNLNAKSHSENFSVTLPPNHTVTVNSDQSPESHRACSLRKMQIVIILICLD